ncbi:type II CAAX prenyl endopeptidase Rce1 family protein [Streptomyces sp. NPDC056488]|uniref:CPBP family glutamic-type intramembrane protease n=1 Tax=unclassified Streptomyces TaxID=2593676 RepID=UPI00368BAC9E
MWLAPAAVCLAILGHVGTIGWSTWSAGQIAALAPAGLCIGLAEELLTRGLVVKVLRDARHSERYVMIGSVLLFALLHLSNLLGDGAGHGGGHRRPHLRLRHLHVPHDAGHRHHLGRDRAARADRSDSLPGHRRHRRGGVLAERRRVVAARHRQHVPHGPPRPRGRLPRQRPHAPHPHSVAGFEAPGSVLARAGVQVPTLHPGQSVPVHVRRLT